MSLDLLTASGLTAALSLLITLVFVVVPPARKWFVALSAETQQAVTGIGILVIAAFAVGAGCAGLITFIPCTVKPIGDYLVSVVVVAIVGNGASKSVFAGARFVDAHGDPEKLRDISPTAGARTPKLLS